VGKVAVGVVVSVTIGADDVVTALEKWTVAKVVGGLVTARIVKVVPAEPDVDVANAVDVVLCACSSVRVEVCRADGEVCTVVSGLVVRPLCDWNVCGGVDSLSVVNGRVWAGELDEVDGWDFSVV
jgi:hypothetical protein